MKIWGERVYDVKKIGACTPAVIVMTKVIAILAL